jgi:hypothetical protein
MKPFKSAGQAQRFLTARAAVMDAESFERVTTDPKASTPSSDLLQAGASLSALMLWRG